MVPKRRAKNPPELQEASKQMSDVFHTLYSVLQTKKIKEDKENDDADLFCKLPGKTAQRLSERQKRRDNLRNTWIDIKQTSLLPRSSVAVS